MPVTKRLLKHVDVEIARGDRKCRRDRTHTIHPGNRCLTIQDEGTPYKRSYCSECALPILKLCAMNLREIRDGLYPQGLPVPVQEPEEAIGKALVEKNRKTRKAKAKLMFDEAYGKTADSPQDADTPAEPPSQPVRKIARGQ